jgi:hypothetical protein
MLGWSKIRYLLPSKNEKEDRHHQMITQLGQAWWFRLVIPAALGAEIGGLWLEASPGKVSIRPNPKKKKKKTWGQGPELNTYYCQKKKKKKQKGRGREGGREGRRKKDRNL